MLIFLFFYLVLHMSHYLRALIVFPIAIKEEAHIRPTLTPYFLNIIAAGTPPATIDIDTTFTSQLIVTVLVW